MANLNVSLLSQSAFGTVNETLSTEILAVFRTLEALCYLLMVIGIPGNALVIATVSLTKQLRTAPNILVLNLSICDCLFLCLIVPWHAYTFRHGQWDTYSEICWLVIFFGNVLIGSSILGTSAIAFNRYVAIVLSSRYRAISRKKTVVVTLIIVYAIPFLLMAPHFTDRFGTLGFDVMKRKCGRMNANLLVGIFAVVVTVLPFVLMTFCYIHILLVTVASRNRVLPANSVNAPRTDSKLSRMLAMIYVVYLVTTLPALLLNILRLNRVPMPPYFSTVAFFVTWTSSAMNPIVYGLANQKYRDAYKALFRKLICGKVICTENNESSSVIPMHLEFREQ